jgi:GNAT superfamily N-acetyltransferase
MQTVIGLGGRAAVHHVPGSQDGLLTTLRWMDVRSLGYRTDLMIRELEGSEVTDRGHYLVIRTPANPSFWWGNFLLLPAPPALGAPDGWLATFAAEFPGAAHLTLGVDTGDAASVDADAFAALELEAELSSVLTATAPHAPPQPNADAICRPLESDDDWRQAAELGAVMYAGTPGSGEEFQRARLAAQRALTLAGHGWWFGAFTGGRLGAQLGLISDGSGLARYQNVETHPDARRQGLAGTLVWQAGRHALAHGARTLVMAADPAEGAIRVYRSVGFTQSETQIGFFRKPE